MLQDPKRTAQEIADWMVKKLEESGQESFVVGVSGGIDSAVAYRLAQLTGKPVYAVFMPKDEEQDERLWPLISDLIDEGVEVDVEYIDDFLQHLPATMHSTDLDRGNFAARMRMSLLYYFAGIYKGLVVGTTNAAEWYIGYYTKYGDGGVDIEPICGLPKHEVYQLGRDGFDVPVPDSILNVAPSANLWPGQTDEGELGYTYDQLDAYITSKEPMTVPLGVQVKIDATHDKTEHKRNQPDHCCISERDCIICTHEG